MKGALLCAGLGTRLAPLTDQLPKPLLPLCNEALARYGLANLRRAGIETVGLNVHYLPERFRAEFGSDVVYSEEPEILGTGGALKRLADRLDLGCEDLVVHNGKVAIDLDVAAVVAHHRNTGALATMVVREVPNASEWGAIDVDESGRVRNVLADGKYMFCGVHVLRPEFVRALPEGACDSVRDGYIPALRRGARISAFVAQGYFAEHSTPERYVASNRAVVAGVGLPQATWPLSGIDAAVVVERGVVIIEPLLVGAGSRLGAGATVGPEVVIGRDVVVAPGAVLARCVVWDSAQVFGNVHDAVVTQSQRVTLVR